MAQMRKRLDPHWHLVCSVDKTLALSLATHHCIFHPRPCRWRRTRIRRRHGLVSHCTPFCRARCWATCATGMPPRRAAWPPRDIRCSAPTTSAPLAEIAGCKLAHSILVPHVLEPGVAPHSCRCDEIIFAIGYTARMMDTS